MDLINFGEIGDQVQHYLNMEAFCNVDNSSHFTTEMKYELEHIKNFFTYAQVIFCFIGVFGNILNLRTLQSPSLQTVPFMYIRAMAVFDLIALSLIMFHFAIMDFKKNIFIMIYTTYIDAPVINTFLIAGLYSALLLTIERYILIAYPHTCQSENPRRCAKRRIGMMLFVSAVIHFPMVFQRTMRQDENGEYSMTNNVELLCKEPNWSIYSWYKLGRECLRFFFVILMTVLNLIIARQLQLTKMRRRRLVRRNTPPKGEISEGEQEHVKKEESTLMKSFTEKKLTALMISICFIFILGNVPQMIVMVLQNEAMENVFGFQVYRYCSNMLEVMNHCLNFYVFCMASSEYTRAFLLNCMCLRRILLRFPSIAKFLSNRRSSSVLATSSGGFGMANKEYLSMESIGAEAREWVVDSSSSPYAQADTRLKSILVTPSGSSSEQQQENRQKKSLTIVNHHTDVTDLDQEDEDEIDEL
ncbi:unnamed protein product [Caenorhabditis angaria]|uniref:G-protein coupled receptors family 1 profile domain-containing protein n=1 Tax=Caenorhabditis angaria TaxID=860376 RepID=A0A9P1J4X1_9PELO|nr:unnamed protein product [Caenorhabditis angaria]